MGDPKNPKHTQVNVIVEGTTSMADATSAIFEGQGNTEHQMRGPANVFSGKLEVEVKLPQNLDRQRFSVGALAEVVTANTHGTPNYLKSGSYSSNPLSPSQAAIANALKGTPGQTSMTLVGVTGGITIPITYDNEGDPKLTAKGKLTLGVATTTVTPNALNRVAIANNPTLPLSQAPFDSNKTTFGGKGEVEIGYKVAKNTKLSLEGSIMQAGTFGGTTMRTALGVTQEVHIGSSAIAFKAALTKGYTAFSHDNPAGEFSLMDAQAKHGLGGTFGMVLTPGKRSPSK